MSESRKDIPIPSPLKRKASEEKMADAFGELSLSKKQRPDDDDPTPPEKASSLIQNGPMPRVSHLLLAPEERHNVPKTLNQENRQEANSSTPILCLSDTFEACVVLHCPRFIDNSMMFQVFDEQGTMFNMQLLQKSVSGTIELDVNHSWKKFIIDHNLEAGDQILFDKNLDTSVSADFYYILNYFKKSESGEKPIGGSESSRKRIGGAEISKKVGDGAESSKKPGDDAESSKKPSDDAGESAPGPVFKVIYRRVFLETLPDQQQRNETAGSRPFPREAICLSKILNGDEFKTQLFFDAYDAIILADNPKVAKIPLGQISMEFLVIDEVNRRYEMTLSHSMRRGPGGAIYGFCLYGWDGFHRDNKLRQGDKVAFYKFLDRNVSSGYYYVVLKLPADVDCLNRRNPVSPGSRPLMPESHCFSKELTRYDVAPGNAGLRLEASQDRHFVSSSRSLNEPFMVFDEADRRYYLKLSYFMENLEGLVCFLDNNIGWKNFVEQNNLKAGDTVDVYKVHDQSVCNDHYFVIRYTRA
ncbi:hypothetical protein CASFOL_005668 [Castilleja foliolosa]|uniref:TF-B3 domain-containing protein n=1 Tax=Castilleja foliolosa TaxID=1961234 RepID=A0ABD3E433_9LAMI